MKLKNLKFEEISSEKLSVIKGGTQGGPYTHSCSNIDETSNGTTTTDPNNLDQVVIKR